MQSKRLLLELIEYIDLFERSVPDAHEMGMESFLAFAHSLHSSSVEPGPHRHNPEHHPQGTEEVDIARSLSLLHRFSRSYIKRALQCSQYLQSEEEYTYLVCLMSGIPLSKTELHQRNGLEKTSGAEVLRRLKKHGLIIETPAEQDKRSILVSITPEGRGELMKIFPDLRLAASVLSGPLDERQRSTLHHLLTHLTDTHARLIATLRDAPLSDYAASLQGAGRG